MKQVISVIIPVFNSSSSLIELKERISSVFENTIRKDFEIIFVDDASSDDSWTILRKLRENDKRVRLISLLKNSGQHLAIFSGLELAKGDLIITMDDDLQHPPEEIPKLLDFLEKNEDCDVVMGVPHQKRHPWFRGVGSKIAMKIISISVGIPQGIKLSSFRLMRRPVLVSILNFRGHSFTIGSLVCHSTARIRNLNVQHDERKYGKSNYSLLKLLTLALTNILNFTVLPLYVISYMGLIISIISFIYFLAIIYMRLTGIIQQAGFATITGMISFFSGLILFSFGIVGAYILRIIKSTNFEKKFIVREEQS